MTSISLILITVLFLISSGFGFVAGTGWRKTREMIWYNSGYRHGHKDGLEGKRGKRGRFTR